MKPVVGVDEEIVGVIVEETGEVRGGRVDVGVVSELERGGRVVEG